MRLGVVGPLPPMRGGISHYNASLVTTLRNSGHQVTAIGFRQLYPRFLFPGTSEIDSSSLPFDDHIEILKAWSPLTWQSALAKLRQSGIERLVFHHWHPFFVPCFRWMARLKPNAGIRVIAHNVIPHEHRQAGIFLNRILFNSADEVIVGGSTEAAELKKLSPKVSSRVVPHPVYDRFSSEYNDLSISEAKKLLGYPPDKPLIMHVGLVRKYKGADLLIEAFSKIKNENALLEIAGEFYDDYDNYVELVKRFGIGNRVKLLNKYLVKEELSLRLRAADVMVLPFRHATQSGIVMAALACGVPVITTSVGALPDVIEPGVTGELVPPENVPALTDAIDSFLAKDEAELQKMRKKIAVIANERFSWQRLVDVLTEEN
ncbi:MAG: glycosyltransferase family 4 protein [Candidatus Electryonea clarkiae]|nr:glycosyltransferase family 4 protein [Candidatus Electryonea clarkiae]MDP8285546.1 glycosyltransferase family 4 protein [Candidatus Electryonea clarkiae]